MSDFFIDHDKLIMIKDATKKEIDITDNAIYYLYEFFYIKKGTTLRDLCKIIDSNKEVFFKIFRNEWISEWVPYILNSPESEPINESDIEDMRSYRIFAYIDISYLDENECNVLHGLDIKCGTVDENYIKKCKNTTVKPGDTFYYSCLGWDYSKYADREIELSDKIDISFLTDKKEYQKLEDKYNKISFLGYNNIQLGDLINTVISEFSLLGSPKDYQERYDKFVSSIKEVSH